MSQHIIKSSNATVQNGVAHADGELVLTESEVRFTPFNKQLGLGPYSFLRSAIAQVEGASAKAGGILPISGDAIKITLSCGQSHEFILANPTQWLEMLRS